MSIGLVAGVMAGMFGIGGGVIIVPALIYLAGMSHITANGTSLAGLLLPVGIFAAILYNKARLIDILNAGMIALGLFLGVIVGAKIAINMSGILLKMLYGFFLLFVSWRFIDPMHLIECAKTRQKYLSFNRNCPNDIHSETTVNDIKKIHWLIGLTLGLFAGVLSGMFGIGGGALIVPVLATVFHYPPKIAAGTSLGALLLPVGLPGVVVYYSAGNLELLPASLVALGLVIGAFFGAKFCIGLPSKTMKHLYGFFLVFIAFSFIIPVVF